MTAATRPFTGRKALALLVGFFAFVALVNGVFIWLAEDSFPGLETEDAYRKGLHYDPASSGPSRLGHLGWQAEIGWQSKGPGRGRLFLRVRTTGGRAVSGLEVRAVMRRPVHDHSDLAMGLPEAAPGTYAADVTLAGGGNWETEFHVASQGAEKLMLRRRLVVR